MRVASVWAFVIMYISVLFHNWWCGDSRTIK